MPHFLVCFFMYYLNFWDLELEDIDIIYVNLRNLKDCIARLASFLIVYSKTNDIIV